MVTTQGRKLFIRSLIETSSEVIPYFWPMRNFIHHNPLYGLEHIPFKEACKKAKTIFHARTYLPRETYIRFLKEGKIKEDILKEKIGEFLKERNAEDLIDVVFTLATTPDLYPKHNLILQECCPEGEKIGNSLKDLFKRSAKEIADELWEKIGKEKTLSEAVDLLNDTDLTSKINDLVARFCMEFLDEGQAVWGMPEREKGFFKAWREVAIRSRRLRLAGCEGLSKALKEAEDPESVIEFVLTKLEIPEDLWEDYILSELSKTHGWSGFVRWRSHAKEYYWHKKHPADLVDLIAIRLLLELFMLKNENPPTGYTYTQLREFFLKDPFFVVVKHDLRYGTVPLNMVDKVEEALEFGGIDKLKEEYLDQRALQEAKAWGVFLARLWEESGRDKEDLQEEDLKRVVSLISEFLEEEGYIWLSAHEETVRGSLEGSILEALKEEDKNRERPFAQALFCIDVRSERFRRNLESLGGYETFGIAGFFGVPISFIELGKGHETYLCPVLIKPKNVVVEMSKEPLSGEEERLVHVLEEVLHDLKNNVLTPYITVEAVGLVFGFDMVGKTLFPLQYGSVREKVIEHSYGSKLLIDKLSKEEVLSLVSLLQREIIRVALREELGVKRVDEEVLEDLRLCALDEKNPNSVKIEGVPQEKIKEFINTLKSTYKIDRGYTRIQIEKLSKIGFTLEEQVFFVERALRSIGLTKNFGKFVLVIGHGSKSDNNPYESALDCGACGGDHGAVNARVFALMANKEEVRARLRELGIDIPKDTHFLACEHNTTNDRIEFFDEDLIPPTHLPLLEKLKADLEEAGKRTALERCRELPTSNCTDEEEAFKEVMKNSMDWTQVRPEWGLSGNYAFIVGRRKLTERLNLKGRVFLHSYNWKEDPKGILLEVILSGPLVVGEWINMEHYFSTVDNESFGSGSKVYHNVVGRFGVITGNVSDLRTGLPAQTVLERDKPHHEPIRLITIVEAPLERVEAIVKRIRKLKELVEGSWILLSVVDPVKGKVFRLS